MRWVDYLGSNPALYAFSSYTINQHVFGFSGQNQRANQTWTDLAGPSVKRSSFRQYGFGDGRQEQRQGTDRDPRLLMQRLPTCT